MVRAAQAAEDARDIARDTIRHLPEYDDTEESTARHEIPQQIIIHNHPSIHDGESEPPAKKIRSGLIALGTGVGLALITASAALLQRCAH